MKKTTLRNLFGLIVLLFATASTSFAQRSYLISVSGYVNYLGTTTPAVGKTVTITVDTVTNSRTTTTGPNGFFMDSIFVFDTARVSFIYARTTDCMNQPVSAFATSIGGASVNNIQLNICQNIDSALIVGTVIDGRTNMPMANTQVMIEPDTALMMSGFIFNAINVTTNSSGVFSVGVPHPGNGVNAGYNVYAMGCGAWSRTKVFSNGTSVGQATLTVCSGTQAAALTGNVFLGPNAPASNYYVAVYQVGGNNANITYVQSGGYSFQNLPTGNYIVAAWLSNSNSSWSSFFPTYAASSSSWTTAQQYAHNASGVNITLISTDSLNGSGSVGGTIGGDSTVTATLRTAYVLSFNRNQARVIISDATTGIDKYYTTLDANGNYTLPSLPFGTYKVRIEYPKMTSPIVTITISAAAPSVNVNFTLAGGNVVASVRRNVNNGALSVYPNPATDVVSVNWSATEISTVRVINALGISVIVPVSVENGRASLNISALKGGIYTVVAQSLNGEWLSQTFVKQ